MGKRQFPNDCSLFLKSRPEEVRKKKRVGKEEKVVGTQGKIVGK